MARKAHRRVPESGAWGFFAYDDGPVFAGGGSGGFLWFRSREEMHEFIAQYLPFWYPNTAAPDPDILEADLGSVLRGSIRDKRMLRPP